MKKAVYLFLAIVGTTQLSAQEFTYSSLFHNSPKQAVVNFTDVGIDYEAQLQLIKSVPPVPAMGSISYKKQQLEAARANYAQQKAATNELKKALPPAPTIIRGFQANNPQGTPNDNDIAVSNDGIIVSVVNQNVALYNDSGGFIFSRTLANFARSLGSLNRTFDPRVVYDPIADRFIVVFLQGTTSADTRIIVAFSQTNNPNATWNFYTIPGNIFGDSSWSDYPIISISNTELFITVNRLKDNTSWQEGFMESIIWQVNKDDGFKGDSLRKKAYYNIKYNNKPIWSICPVKGSSMLYGPNHYFVSVRPGDLRNDTVFLHEISNTLDANPTLTLKVLKTNVPYGLQPNAPQPGGQYMQTNDARALSALKHENTIHYVGNSINEANFAPSVYYGRIDVSNAQQPTVSGKIISYDSMDIGYPSIAYAGGGFKTDQTMLISFSHVSETKFAGNSAVFVARDGEVSAPIHVKLGEGNINVLLDSIERWGDYSGIQPKYNKLGECYLANSYGLANGNHRTWIARIRSNDPLLGLSNRDEPIAREIHVFPVPSSGYVQVEFELKEKLLLEFSIINVLGQNNEVLLVDHGKPGINRFSLNTDKLSNGTYIINIKNHDNIITSKRIIVAH
ncbi:MAG: T9SS C-terminal target domain-containing protein [Bacteroidetes bacterium]|nr:MAG: T9SS C-terminal target domain-containing protein [Bacteroidota bacterium]